MHAPTGLIVFPKLMPVGEDIILPCMTILPSFSCENATSLYTREAFFWFSFYYLVPSFLIVGATIGRPSFIKISFCLKRTVGDAGPYRFWLKFYILLVVEHSICSRKGTGGYGIRPYGQNVKIRTHFVGDDVLGVPFIKISLCFARTTNGRPYRFNGCPKIRL